MKNERNVNLDSSKFDGRRRGDRSHGGLYVGTSEAGVEWIAYNAAEFPVLCRNFDERARRVAERRAAKEAQR